jgi:hypothetical protein
MKNIHLLLIVFTIVICSSCENVQVEKEISQDSTQEQKIEESENAEVKSVDVDSLVAAIDTKRAEIENSASDPVAVSTSDLKEKIKQKWDKIHYYTIDGKLVRIKTYPHENITNRTEEFYLENDELLLAVIEDDGTGERGKSTEDIDKLYYFADGELIHEIHKSEEREYSLRKSDAEELQTEVREYIDIFNSQTGN